MLQGDPNGLFIKVIKLPYKTSPNIWQLLGNFDLSFS